MCLFRSFLMNHKGLGYAWWRGLAHNFANTNQTENPNEFLEVGENKQLRIVIIMRIYYCFQFSYHLIHSPLFNEVAN